MSTSWNGFRQDLAASTAVGLTRGATLPYQRLEGPAETEMRYRQQRLLKEAARKRQQKQAREAGKKKS
ncbi:hypothetical protein [Kineosporia sp. NBRC 101731]|uniref:hypothetical protein n=1 Tax=Kineosporia sp. NBRC 101731 TaxID=3032199 RepID=UPI0024A15130|nr:hypothetical protein [Kineosporia sp. NBRC 101731]GLY33378.1 hypothetical protein Kisp02_67430 [Kineosporia sp. NBRC 101731]